MRPEADMSITNMHCDVTNRGPSCPEGEEVLDGLPTAGLTRQTYEIICGDARDVLRELPQVHCVVTSPPYLGQRVYGHSEAEIGKGEDPDEYVAELCDLFDAIPLARQGSLWVNVGDKRRDGALMGIPSRLAVAMQCRGWRLVDSVAWVKGIVRVDGTTIGSYMPEPATNRLNGNAWEPLFRFTRATTPWTDNYAIRIPRANVPDVPHMPPELMVCGTSVEGRAPPNAWMCPPGKTSLPHFACFDPSLVERSIAMTCPPWINSDGSWPERIADMVPYDERRGGERRVGKSSQVPEGDDARRANCGRADVGRTYVPRKPSNVRWSDMDPFGSPAIVLDPFCGTGTTGEVAIRLGRSFIGIDLYEEYCQMSRERCEDTLLYLEEHALDPLAIMR